MDEELDPSPRPAITRDQALDRLNHTLPLEAYAAVELIEHVTSRPDFFLDPPIRVASPVRTSWTVSIGIEDRYVRRDAPLLADALDQAMEQVRGWGVPLNEEQPKPPKLAAPSSAERAGEETDQRREVG